METTNTSSSKIQWYEEQVSKQNIHYASLGLLYNETRDDLFGDHMGFVLSCICNNPIPECISNSLQKLEVVARPNFNDAKLAITHEVFPDLGRSSQIIPVNESLQVACFNEGCIIGIKNFGYNKTFNSDVRNKLCHHGSEIYCLAASSQGNRLASGGTRSGEVTLYQVRRECIDFLARTKICDSLVAGLAFLKPSDQMFSRPPLGFDDNHSNKDGEFVLVWATDAGQMGFMDTRVADGKALKPYGVVTSNDPKVSFTTLCSVPELPGHQVFFGGTQGELVVMDFRNNRNYLFYQKNPRDRFIRRMKKILVGQGLDKKIIVAYTNQTNEIQIYDAKAIELDSEWRCDRNPVKIQRDLIQVGNRIVTCGDDASIGCWEWDPYKDVDEN